MADISELVDKAFADRAFSELADLPIDTLQGVSKDDAERIREAFGVRTIRQLAEHRLIRAARAITVLAGPAAGTRAEVLTQGGSVVISERSGVSGGYPVVDDTRIAVRSIVEAFRETGSVQGAIDAFPQLRPEQVRGALDYYRRHPQRVDEDIESNARALAEIQRR